MTSLVKTGFVNQVNEQQVEAAIITLRGPDPRTLKNWKRALETVGYLEKQANRLYRIHLEKLPDLLVEVTRLEESKRQVKLM